MRKLKLNEQEVIDVYEKYENARQTSEVFGCSTQTVYRILEKHGIPRTHRHQKHGRHTFASNCRTKHCPAVVRLLYVAGGCSTSEISSITCIPLVSVCDIMRRRYGDLYRSRRDAARSADIDAIERDYLAGSSSYELGEKYGVSHSTISKWMRKRGHRFGRGHGPSQTISHDKAVARFLEQYPSQINKCETWRERGSVRRKYRIVSRPHDGGACGLRWQDVYEHNGHDLTCWICKKKCMPMGRDRGRRPSIDHVIPLSNGGTDTYDNSRIACIDCNRRRSNRVQMTLDFLRYEQG